jgi:hypothetical protein
VPRAGGRRRGTGLRPRSVPPSAASRRALSRAISAWSPACSTAVFSRSPLNSWAFASSASSMIRVVRICINMVFSCRWVKPNWRCERVKLLRRIYCRLRRGRSGIGLCRGSMPPRLACRYAGAALFSRVPAHSQVFGRRTSPASAWCGVSVAGDWAARKVMDPFNILIYKGYSRQNRPLSKKMIRLSFQTGFDAAR